MWSSLCQTATTFCFETVLTIYDTVVLTWRWISFTPSWSQRYSSSCISLSNFVLAVNNENVIVFWWTLAAVCRKLVALFFHLWNSSTECRCNFFKSEHIATLTHLKLQFIFPYSLIRRNIAALERPAKRELFLTWLFLIHQHLLLS